MKNGPFAEESLRAEWRDRLNKIPGVSLALNCLHRRSSFNLLLLCQPDAVATFKDTYGWVIEKTRAFDQDGG